MPKDGPPQGASRLPAAADAHCRATTPLWFLRKNRNSDEEISISRARFASLEPDLGTCRSKIKNAGTCLSMSISRLYSRELIL
jgi:hypothetical protein